MAGRGRRATASIDVIETLRASAAGTLDLLSKTSDLVLAIQAGTVVGLAARDPAFEREARTAWLGRAFADVVTDDSREKARALLSPDSPSPVLWREIDHIVGAATISMRYVASRIGPADLVVAVGQDLQETALLHRRLAEAHLDIERDYAHARDTQARFQTLFQASSDAMLVVDLGSRKIVDANSAAEDVLYRVAQRLAGLSLLDLFDDASAAPVREGFASTRAAGKAEWPRVHLRHAGAPCDVTAWLIRGQGVLQALLRLRSVEGGRATPEPDASWRTLRQLPDAIVIARADLTIVEANEAFLDLVETATVDQVRGQSLARFLRRHEIELAALASRLRGGPIRRFATVVLGGRGTVTDVEVSASGIGAGEGSACTLLFRPYLAGRAMSEANGSAASSADDVTRLVGRVSLREIVRESVDIMEELCIKAALDLTGDNRASAAEMLGLSRQGLYSKLRRYGLGDLPPGDV